MSLVASSAVSAHHSFIEFDQTVTEEYAGEIVEIFWRNPHIRMSIRADNPDGSEVVWDMEAQDLNTIESDDVVRVIHMNVDAGAEAPEPMPLGYSIGRWEDDKTLVVTTTHVSWPYTKLNGLVAVPQSETSMFVERFRLSEDGNELSLSFTMTDSVTFTESVTAENYTVWRWLPGAVVEPYECTLD